MDFIKKSLWVYADLLGLNQLFSFFNHQTVVLMYHGVVPDNYPIESWTLVKASQFRKQMEYLKEHCNVVSFTQALHAKAHSSHKSKPDVIITFDDGYRNNYLWAYPVLKEFEFPCVIFVVTDYIDSPELFWFDKVILSIQHSQCEKLDLADIGDGVFPFNRTYASKRWDDIQFFLTWMKGLDPRKREDVVIAVQRSLFPKVEKINELNILKSDDIKEMESSGLVEFGSHTHGHEILTRISQEEAKLSIRQSIFSLEQLIEKKVKYFSYPNGDYNKEIRGILKDEDIKAAFTTVNEFWSPHHDMLSIPRIGIGGYDSFNFFKAKISGFFRLVTRMKTLLIK